MTKGVLGESLCSCLWKKKICLMFHLHCAYLFISQWVTGVVSGNDCLSHPAWDLTSQASCFVSQKLNDKCPCFQRMPAVAVRRTRWELYVFSHAQAAKQQDNEDPSLTFTWSSCPDSHSWLISRLQPLAQLLFPVEGLVCTLLHPPPWDSTLSLSLCLPPLYPTVRSTLALSPPPPSPN